MIDTLKEHLLQIDVDGKTIRTRGILESLIESENGFTCIINVSDLSPSMTLSLHEQIENLERIFNTKISVVTTKNTPLKPRPSGVKNIIAIASGKGGVGKSTTTCFIAKAMADIGLKVGVLDLDIYGPSIPHMIKHYDKPKANENGKLIPAIKNNIQFMSIGFMIPEAEAIIWRGPVVQKAVQQLFFDVAWDNVDCLILDLPPGTGDVQLSMSQKLHLDGVIIVSTPQDLAMIDAKKALNMFDKLSVPILGLVENMSALTCPNCAHEFHPFTTSGVQNYAEQNSLPFLGTVPLDLHLRNACDAGIFNEEAEDSAEKASHYMDVYRNIALNIIKSL
jgi:ATP-binding protein involved in chromosome partitioning